MLKSDTALVIFGATGDLGLRMLYPSLYFLEHEGLLPDGLVIIGTDRSEFSAAEFLNKMEKNLKEHAAGHFTQQTWSRLSERLRYIRIDVQSPEDFRQMDSALSDMKKVVFYLATSPNLYDPICKNLQQSGLAAEHSCIVLEKPLGRDSVSCKQINSNVAEVFSEESIFRVDHYLGKETVQNLMVLRFANSLLEPVWDRNGIEHVQITVSETIGVEGRWSFYDEIGALRDMVQNHILQLLCLIAIEPPLDMASDSVRDEKVKVLRALRPIEWNEVKQKSVRGQYMAGAINGTPVRGYLEEGNGQNSNCETFVALRCEIDNWRWSGVPFYIRTGKRLPHRYTEIIIQFREVPHSIFSGSAGLDLNANKLIIRLQPEEKIQLLMMNKVPGLTSEGIRVQSLPLNLSWSDAFHHERGRIAYERLLLDAIHGNKTLFVRRDEAEMAWSWIDGIQEGWNRVGMVPNYYAAGTWGPSAAFALTERFGHSWYE